MAGMPIPSQLCRSAHRMELDDDSHVAPLSGRSSWAATTSKKQARHHGPAQQRRDTSSAAEWAEIQADDTQTDCGYGSKLCAADHRHAAAGQCDNPHIDAGGDEPPRTSAAGASV